MYIGNVNELSFTQVLHPKIREIFSTVQACLETSTAEGRYEVEGDNAFFMVVSDHTHPGDERIPECHRQYLDIQWLLEGDESYGVGIETFQNIDDDQFDEKDIAFSRQVKDERYVTLSRGDFIVFYPGQPHRPLVAPHDMPGPIKKVIVKINKDILQ
ncbi:YhcH/YjgK/YiaL family protein [Vibrio palustris]|uniref:Toxin-antitoxin biofilm protein TabA n=1 Tax=Vibrio palustris TaxID=1918946 RepID=A0A1R4B368_9VIBR|nr:YhcH/YjgK/YiaL family protein [Vibrio palustris]SJL83362.1 Toxin-antitoxin biofilm protein TabA [Vibrio palustris]